MKHPAILERPIFWPAKPNENLPAYRRKVAIVRAERECPGHANLGYAYQIILLSPDYAWVLRHEKLKCSPCEIPQAKLRFISQGGQFGFAVDEFMHNPV